MEPNAPCWLVVNPASGSNNNSSTDTLVAALTERGWRVDRTVAFPDDTLPDPSTLDAAGIAHVVIYTGDGTMNTLIDKLAGWHGQVLVLPGGTMNLLPLRLHRTTDVDAILDIVAGGGALARRVNCVRCPAGLALAGLLVGPGTAWGRVRESMRNFAIADIAKDTIDAVKESTSGPMVRFENSRLSRDAGYPLLELTPGEHGVQIAGYYADAPLDLAGQAWATVRRRFREGPHDRLGIATELTITTVDGSPLPCLIDGEAAECPSGSRFVVESCGVDLLATSHDV